MYRTQSRSRSTCFVKARPLPSFLRPPLATAAALDSCLGGRLVADGIDVIGPVDHKICQSIYFFDPSGHRMELTVATSTPELDRQLARDAGPILAEWNRTKRAPEVGFLHDHSD